MDGHKPLPAYMLGEEDHDEKSTTDKSLATSSLNLKPSTSREMSTKTLARAFAQRNNFYNE